MILQLRCLCWFLFFALLPIKFAGAEYKRKQKSIIQDAYCELKVQPGAEVVGYHKDELVPVASVSKIFTSLWAIAKKGANFRFETQVIITRVNDKEFDVHLVGSGDPVMNHQELMFLVSELNQLGIRKIRYLSFDENFYSNLFIRELPSRSSNNGPNQQKSIDEIKANLNLIFNQGKWSSRLKSLFKMTQNLAARSDIRILDELKMQVDYVGFISQNEFVRPFGSEKYSFFSAPLFRILKDMNVYSNNAMADYLFAWLGGVEEFNKFMGAYLQAGPEDSMFFSGSGLPTKDKKGSRRDNLATCSTILMVLNALDNELAKLSLDSSSVLMVVGVDGFDGAYYGGHFYRGGTLGASFGGQGARGAIVAKSGTLDTIKSVAGYAQSRDGKYYYGIVLKVSGRSKLAQARAKLGVLVNDLIQKHGGSRKISYSFAPFLPFDKYSGLRLKDPSTTALSILNN